MGVHARVSEVLVNNTKRYKFTSGRTERSLVCHGTFSFSKCSQLRDLNSAQFSSCYYHCSRVNWRLDCTCSSVLVDPNMECWYVLWNIV